MPPSFDSLDLPPFRPRFPWWGPDLQTLAILLRPANLVRLAPPDMGFRLLAAPETLSLGARVAVGLRRWGVTLRLETAEPLEEVARLAGRGVRLARLRIDRPDLESVFLTLTGRRLRD